MTIPTTDLYKHLAELENKARRYDNRREIDQKIVEKAKQALDHFTRGVKLMEEALKDLDPVQTLGAPRKERNTHYKEILKELYEKVQAGTEIGSELIAKLYNTDKSATGYIMKQISNMPNIDRRMDGKKLYLYAKVDK